MGGKTIFHCFCEQTQSFFGEHNSFAKERNFFASKVSLGKEHRVTERKCFASEHNVGQGNAVLLQESANVLSEHQDSQGNDRKHMF